MKKRDLLLVVGIVLVAALLLAVGMLANRGKTATGTINVYVNGAFYTSATIEKDKTLTIEQADGSINVLRMTENGFFMEYSTCDNQLCVEQGTVNSQNWNTRSLGTHILCLPNRVDAELALTDSEKQEIDINAPDV